MKVNSVLDVRREPHQSEPLAPKLPLPALDAKGHAEPDQGGSDEVSDVHGAEGKLMAWMMSLKADSEASQRWFESFW